LKKLRLDVSKERDKYFVMYGSLVTLLECDEDDEVFLEAFDEVLTNAMLLEMNRRSL
jgi:hypothetical protein